MSGHAETLDIANAASGIKGCDAVFPYDSTAAYGGMRDWALLLLAENQRLREFVIAHTLVEKGVTDFDLQNEAVERLRRASEGVKDIIREALAGDGE